MYRVTIRFKDLPKPVVQEVQGFEVGPTTITLEENDRQFSIVPLASFVYMDVEVIDDAEGVA